MVGVGRNLIDGPGSAGQQKETIVGHRAAVLEIERRAVTQLGPTARSLGIVWGTRYQDGGQDWTETWKNAKGEKHTFGYWAKDGSVY